MIGEVQTNQYGEFVFIKDLLPGNYELSLLSSETMNTFCLLSPHVKSILLGICNNNVLVFLIGASFWATISRLFKKVEFCKSYLT